MIFVVLTIILAHAILFIAALWPINPRLDRKLPSLPETRRRRPF